MSKDTPSTLIKEIERELEFMTKIPEERCMYKVHEQLCDVSEKAYKPVLLAIGPYSNQDEVGQGFMKEHKLRYLQQMINRTGGSVETYFRALKEEENEIRKHYSECIHQKSDEFVKMMLLDGCFIIELFCKYKIYKKNKKALCSVGDPIFEMQWVLSRIARDLLLFENQLPFFVLAKLFEMSKSNVGSSSTASDLSIQTRLTDLALGFFFDNLPFCWNVDARNYISKGKIESLLCRTQKAQTISLQKMVEGRLELGFRFKNEYFMHLLGLIHASISISILDTEINNAIEPHDEEMAEICKHVICLVSEAVIRLLEKMKIKRNPEDSMAKTGQDREGEIIPVLVPLMAAQTNNGYVSYEIEERRHSEDNMPKTDQEREKKLIWFRSELKKAKVESQMVEKFEKDFHKTKLWEDELNTSCASELFEAGIEFEEAKKFMDLLCDHELQISIPYRKFLLKVGIEIEKARKFMDLLGLKEIEHWEDESIPYASELQEAEIEFEKAKRFMVLVRDLHHRHRNEDQMSIPYGKFLRKAGIETKKARKFMDLLELKEIECWEDELITYDSELQEAGIEFAKAKKFMFLVRDLHHRHMNEDQKSIPYRKFLREAGVEIKKAIKFMDLLALKEVEDLNIYGAIELKEAGIEFKKLVKVNNSTEEKKFGIKFNKGKMEISTLSIEDQTETCFRNLIAYEQYSCDGDRYFNYVTDYASFMDSLINSPKDVQLLRDRGIIKHCLGDDEVISKMVNKLVHNIDLSTTNIYARTSQNINMHCRKLWPKWKAKLRHDYFNTPWAWISFLAAVLLLGLTIVQTVLSIIS